MAARTHRSSKRFQVETQPGGVVPYLIEQPPATLQLSKGDTFASVVSQIRAAADVWNSVGTATFRFEFGGMATPNITMNSPSVLVSFDDELPPGIIAMGGPITRGDPVTLQSGDTIVPIVQSSLVIGSDLRLAQRVRHRVRAVMERPVVFDVGA